MNKKVFFAIAVLMSTIIGAGIFGLPYAAAQFGFLIATIILFVVFGIVLTLHLFYAEIIQKTNKEYQLTGYIDHYLGIRAKNIVGFFAIVGFYGSLLIYMILGGDFLHIFLSQFFVISQLQCSMILFLIGSFALYFGLKIVSRWDLVINLILVGIIIILFIFAIGNVQISNIKSFNLDKSFILYGAMFYSLIGIAAIPEARRVLLPESKNKYKKVIFIGTLIPAIIYLIFIFTVLGLAGEGVSPDAIYVLQKYVGEGTVIWGSLFGFLMILSSYLSLGIALKQTYVYDFKVSKNWAWFLTCIIPVALLLAGVSNFILIIEIMGAIIGAFEGTSIVLMYNRLVKPKPIKRLLGYSIIGIMLVGLAYTLLSIIA